MQIVKDNFLIKALEDLTIEIHGIIFPNKKRKIKKKHE